MATVTVVGQASAALPPDRASLELAISTLDRQATVALDRTAERARALEALLRELTVPDRDWTTGGISVAEQYEWRDNRNELVGHRASVSVRVVLRDFALLARLLTEAVSRAGAAVSGPAWEIDPDNPALLALLGEAAVDARRRAGAYAAGLGMRLGEAEAVSETPFSEPGPPQPMPKAREMRAAMAMDASADVPVNAGQVDVSARVHVRFALLAAPDQDLAKT
jgi:uncharacterized protein YggE